MNDYSVYILASNRNGTLYVGSTSDLVNRVYEHKNDFVEGFTKKYGVHMLVYYETGGDHEGALLRERQIKEWKRRWKIELIEKTNPGWRDLYEDILS
jgi:putative endonuclease